MFYKKQIKPKQSKSKLFRNVITIIFTFIIVCLGWVLFRSDTLADALHIYHKMLQINIKDFEFVVRGNGSEFGITSSIISLIMIFLLFMNERFQNVQQTSLTSHSWKDIAFNSTLLFLIIVFGVFQKTSFIYFQF